MASKVSVVIPVKQINDYLRKETIPSLLDQSYKNFEIIILPDKKTKEKFPKTRVIPTWPKTGPADKRDLGAKKARGVLLAFLDDDSYPAKDWLKNAVGIFKKGGVMVAGVCGPQLTPPRNNLRQKASGWVWASWLGSGGAGTYRCSVADPCEVDDYPTVNLLVRRADFFSVGGFCSAFWPGEDTKLCHDLVYGLGKRLKYDPTVLVYHHRREVFLPHLRQIGRYALHRGHFARILPKTSMKIGYFIPSLFLLGLIGGPVLIWLSGYWQGGASASFLVWLYVIGLLGYLFLHLMTAIQVYRKDRNVALVGLTALAIFATHVSYGFLFIKGLLTSKLKSSYHR